MSTLRHATLLLATPALGALLLGLRAPQDGPTERPQPTPEERPDDPAPTIRPEWRNRSNSRNAARLDALEGRPAPALSGLSDWKQTSALDWKGLQGRYVLIDFWGTWCQPCLASMPKLVGLQRDYPKDLLVLSVHVPRGYDPTKVDRTASRHSMTWALAGDVKGEYMQTFAVESIPNYSLVGPDGKVLVAGIARAHVEDVVRAFLGKARPTPMKDEDVAWPPHVTKPLFAKHDLRGKPAPEFVVEKWFHKEPDRKDKVVLIEFWTTRIRTSRERIRSLGPMHEALKDDLVIIGVTADNFDNARSMWYSQGNRFYGAVDSQMRMHDALGIESLPHTLLISSDGIVRWQGFGDSPEDSLTQDVVRQVIAKDKAERRARAAQDGAPKDGAPKDKTDKEGSGDPEDAPAERKPDDTPEKGEGDGR